MTAALRKSPKHNHKFQTPPSFKKPIVTGKFSSHPLMKRMKKETTNTNLHHRSRCTASLIAAGMPVKMTMENQISPLTIAIITSIQKINALESVEEKQSP